MITFVNFVAVIMSLTNTRVNQKQAICNQKTGCPKCFGTTGHVLIIYSLVLLCSYLFFLANYGRAQQQHGTDDLHE